MDKEARIYVAGHRGRVGSALVRGPHGTIGLVTERDIVRAIADGASVSRTRVEEVMSEDLITVGPNDDLLDAVHRMLDAEVRHMPIMENGVAAGMISARDALRAFVDRTPQTTPFMSERFGFIAGARAKKVSKSLTSFIC